MKLVTFLVVLGPILSQGSCPTDDRHCAYCISNKCQVCYDALLSNGTCIETPRVNRTDQCWTYNGFSPCTNCNRVTFLTETETVSL